MRSAAAITGFRVSLLEEEADGGEDGDVKKECT
jgi:hypothetical protein